jgi:hypothetical protein
MTRSAVVFTSEPDSNKAGNELAGKIAQKFNDRTPDVVIVFASSIYDYHKLLHSINTACRPSVLVGSSSAGEFTSTDFGTDSACALAIYSDEMKFSAGIAEGISQSREKAAEGLVKALKGTGSFHYKHHSAMVFADALSGYTDELIDQLTEKTAGIYQFFGGGAGDNAQFKKTHVFMGERAYTDAAVILEMLSNKPIGIGVSHGWKPAGGKMKVTDAEGMRLISINAMPAVEMVEEYAKTTKQSFDKNNPTPFFLHNVFGVELADGYKLRVPLAVQDDGALLLASDIPKGATIRFMSTDSSSTQHAALNAANSAMSQLEGNKPNVALFFDCVATRLRMGTNFGYELEEVKNAISAVNYAGCNTYGQVTRVNGQFSGFHNCTAVVCVIPE